MKLFAKSSHDLVIVVLRFSVGATLLWFGVDKWVHPEVWMRFLPSSIAALDGGTGLMAVAAGTFEFVMGILLVAGVSLRPAAALSGLYLTCAVAVVGVNAMTVRDAALIGSLLALFIEANGKSRRPVSAAIVSRVCTAYVLFLFLVGVLYLRGRG